MSVNKVIIVGRLGQDPEVKYTPSGAAVSNFSVATSEAWTDKEGQKQERTEWHRIVVWGKQAENCGQYLAKGSQVYLEGTLQTRSWDAPENGGKRYTTEVVARTVQFLSGRANASQGDNAGYAKQQQAPQQSFQPQNQNQNQGSAAPAQNYNISTDSSFTADDIPF